MPIADLLSLEAGATIDIRLSHAGQA